MDKVKDKLSELDVLVCGLAFTSRTETVENYLKDRVKSLTVIALSSFLLKENLSSCRVYKEGFLTKQFKVYNFRIKDYSKWYRQPLLLIVFMVNWFFIFFSIAKLGKKFDLCIGISHSYAFVGSILKMMKRTSKFIYYSTDYYIPHNKFNFLAFFVLIENAFDKWIVKRADIVWNVSPRILEARERFGKVRIGTYKNIVAPLGYDSSLLRYKPIELINKRTAVFVGTLDFVQGLQLLVETTVLVIDEINDFKVRVIGCGPHEDRFKKLIEDFNLKDCFIFHGFIKDEAVMLDILSSCAIGVAPYVVNESHVYYADSGKPKLYAFCGLPSIVTKVYVLAEEMHQKQAAIAIDYDKHDFAKAIVALLKDETNLKRYKENAFDFAKAYISENIFDSVFEQTLECLGRF